MKSLSLDRVSKLYGSAWVLDDVSLALTRGGFLSLLGPSGSGKKTMPMSIAGFVAPASGEIRLDDAPMKHLPPEKRNFGMVFQGYVLFPRPTVARNIAFPLEVRGQPRADIERRVKDAPAAAPLVPAELKTIGPGAPENVAVQAGIDADWYEKDYSKARQEFLDMIAS